MMTPRIIAQSLGKRFNREWIFRNLSMEFEPGRVYAITGPNGSGKSTLMQILWGQLPPSEGTVSYTINNHPLEEEALFHYVAVATPYMDLIEELTLTEHINFHFKTRQPSNGLTTDKMIQLMYLEAAKDKPIANFSSGMKQRLKLGLAFFTHAPILFLDEPGTNLDHQALAWYQEQVHQIQTKSTVLIASNQLEEYPDSAIKIDLLGYKSYLSRD